MTGDLTHPGPFDTLEEVFGVLCAGPAPLALEAGAVPTLPRRELPLDEVRAILLHPSTSHRTRDAALGVLLGRARAEGGRWTVGLAGVLLFGLRRATSLFCEMCPDKVDDIEAEALAGLIAGIERTDPHMRRLAARLVWLARNQAKRLVARELAEVARRDHEPMGDPPARPYGHPDLVLVQAVREGVLCAEDAALIGDTRLGLMTVPGAARALGIEAKTAYKRRDRGEAALVGWLTGPDYEAGFVENRGVSPYLDGGGRPRQGRAHDRPSAAYQPPSTTRR